MGDDYKRNSTESAMRDGTILGLLWIVTFAAWVMVLKSIGSSYIFVISSASAVLMFSSPVLAYMLAIRHRDYECNGTMSYSEAWIQIIIMYVCAILISSIAQLIFYVYIDPNLYADIIPLIEKIATEADLPSADTELLIQIFKTFNNISAKDIIVSQMSGHITRDILLTSLLAFIVKKRNRK